MKIEVVYAKPQRQERVALELPPGASAADAVALSGLLARHPELGGGAPRLGLAGLAIAPQRRLRDGDRVEILRPLGADPMEARRLRARRARRR